MDVAHRIQETSDDVGSRLLGKGLAILDHVIELASLTQFQNWVEVILVMEKTVYFSDIGMLKIVLDFDFPDELGQEILFDQALFLYDFQCDHKTCFLFDCQENTTELTLPQLLNNIEVLDGEFQLLGVRVWFFSFMWGFLEQLSSIL